MKRKFLLVLACVALAACSAQKAPQATDSAAAHPSSTQPVRGPQPVPAIPRGISASDRATIVFTLFSLEADCSIRMGTAELLAHGVKHLDGRILSEKQLVSDTNSAFAKSAATYSVWIQKLQPYPGVIAALKAVRVAQYECALDTVMDIENGSLNFDTARADYGRAFEKAKRELHAELDAVPVADDEHGLALPYGANQRTPTQAPAARR